MSRTLRALFLLTLLVAAAYTAPVDNEEESSSSSTEVADGEEFMSSTSSAEEETFTTREEDYSSSTTASAASEFDEQVQEEANDAPKAKAGVGSQDALPDANADAVQKDADLEKELDKELAELREEETNYAFFLIVGVALVLAVVGYVQRERLRGYVGWGGKAPQYARVETA